MTELEAVPGVGPSIAKKLKDYFITTAEVLAVQNISELMGNTGIGEGTATKIVKAARNVTGMFGFKSGLDIEKEMKSKPKLKVGIESLDNTMQGGIETGSLVEFYGPARGGKTQWCAHLAVRAQLSHEDGGLEGRILWLDTESSFKPIYIRANALRYGLDPEVALENIGKAEVVLSDQWEDYINIIQKKTAEEEYKLVVADSLTGLFRAEFAGIGTLATRQQLINKNLNRMRRIARATDAIFVYTNQVTTQMGGFFTNPNAPAGGHIVSHASDYRFYTRVGSSTKKKMRKLALKDNASIPEFDQVLWVGWGGYYGNEKEMKGKEKDLAEQLEALGETTEIDDSKEEGE